MINSISKDVICVSCKSDQMYYSPDGSELQCAECKCVYPVTMGIPILINETESIFTFKDFLNQRNLFFDISRKGKLIQLISSLMPNTGWNISGKRNFSFLEKLLIEKTPLSKPRVLVVGGSIVGEGMSDFVKSVNIDLVEGDVSFGPRTKIIFDGHSIPFRDASFDGVIVQAVLEHLVNPSLCVREIHRVLKPKGLIYAETPFMQQVHGGAYDFTRFTKSGHRKLLNRFEEIKSGSTSGSGTALAWSYEYFLLALFGYSKQLRLAVKLFARITGFWIKYLDILTRLNPRDLDGASGLFFIGKKADQRVSDKDIINYYL